FEEMFLSRYGTSSVSVIARSLPGIRGRRSLERRIRRVDSLQMEPREDSWESVGWEADAQQLERDEVLRLARHLAEQREGQRAEDLAEIEELKRTLRERAAQVAVREADVERRRLEIEERDAAIRGGSRHSLRF